MQRHWSADAIDWQERGDDGTKYAVLHGDRRTPDAAFAYAFFIPAGFWDPPHWHGRTAHVFVARGALQLGYGTTRDVARLARHTAGSMLIVPAEARHFDGADEDTVIFGVATGP
ncbi:MAG: cupin domain-containing protein [Pseudomonadota bacterium]